MGVVEKWDWDWDWDSLLDVRGGLAGGESAATTMGLGLRLGLRWAAVLGLEKRSASIYMGVGGSVGGPGNAWTLREARVGTFFAPGRTSKRNGTYGLVRE